MIAGYHPLVTTAEARDLEKAHLRGLPDREWAAMHRAGEALAEQLWLDWKEIGPWPEPMRILILAGKGNNAGDALIAAERLAALGPLEVDVLFALGTHGLGALPRRAWRGLTQSAAKVTHREIGGRGDPLTELREHFGKPYHVCIDGLFGMNFEAPLRSPIDEVVKWANDEMQAQLRASVDLPSGLGDDKAETAFRADFTYMTGSAKTPNFRPENAGWTGRLRYLDLDFFETSDLERERVVLLPAILDPLRRLRPAGVHKRHLGHVVVLGGSRRMPGAALMAIRAALTSGAGLVTGLVPETFVPQFAAMVPEAMWIGCPETPEGGLALESLGPIETILSQAGALVLGPGIGTERETQALMKEVAARATCPVVIDAEALQPEIVEAASRGGRAIVTPHAGEYKRLGGRDVSEEGLLEYCRRSGAVAILKGPPFSRICDGAKIAYAISGGPVLARGGSGDLLAGITGALAARSPDNLWEVACRATAWHGAAADAMARSVGQEAVRTTQLLDYLGEVLRNG